MFICHSCHVTTGCAEMHFSGSYGPCETCGKTSSCVDCHGGRRKLPVDKEPKCADIDGLTPIYFIVNDTTDTVIKRVTSEHGYFAWVVVDGPYTMNKDGQFENGIPLKYSHDFFARTHFMTMEDAWSTYKSMIKRENDAK